MKGRPATAESIFMVSESKVLDSALGRSLRLGILSVEYIKAGRPYVGHEGYSGLNTYATGKDGPLLV